MFDGVGGNLGPVFQLKLFHDIFQMAFHGIY